LKECSKLRLLPTIYISFQIFSIVLRVSSRTMSVSFRIFQFSNNMPVYRKSKILLGLIRPMRASGVPCQRKINRRLQITIVPASFLFFAVILVLMSAPGGGSGSPASESFPGENGRTLVVDPAGENDGQNFTRISWALENVTDGDEIVLYPGNYTEFLNISNSVGLRALHGEGVNLTSPVGYNTPVYVTADNVTLSGLELSGSIYGILLDGTGGVNIESCVFDSNKIGINFFLNSGGSVRSCRFSGNDLQGVLVRNSTGIVFEENDFHDNPGDGMSVRYSSDLVLKENTFNENNGNGMSVLFTTGLVLENNTFSNQSRGSYSISVYGEHPDHYDHTIGTDNTVNGLPVYYIFGEEKVSLYNLTSGHISIMYADSVDLDNISLLDGDGLYLQSVNNTVVRNFTAINNPWGLCLWNCSDITLDAITLEDNILGVYAQRCRSLTISDVAMNITAASLRDFDTYGISLLNVTGTEILNSRIENFFHGIWSGASGNVTVSGCLISRCVRGLDVQASQSRHTVTNNRFENNTDHMVMWTYEDHLLDNNTAISYIRIEIQNQTGAPLTEVDYRLEYLGRVVTATPGYGGGAALITDPGGVNYLYMGVRLDNEFFSRVKKWAGEVELINLSLKKGEWEIVRSIGSYNSRPYRFSLGPPDLSMGFTGISFSKNRPLPGETVTITASFHNNGHSDVEAAKVNFYVRDLEGGEAEFIGSRIISAAASFARTYRVSVEWTSREGSYEIVAVLDLDNTVNESSEKNNEARRNITVSGEDDERESDGKKEESWILLLMVLFILMGILAWARMRSDHYLKEKFINSD